MAAFYALIAVGCHFALPISAGRVFFTTLFGTIAGVMVFVVAVILLVRWLRHGLSHRAAGMEASRRGRLLRRLAGSAVLWSVLASVTFFVAPEGLARSLSVLPFASFAVLSAIWLLVAVMVELIHARWRASLALAAAAGSGILTALSFFGIPAGSVRAAMVITFGVIAALSAACLLALVSSELAHKRLHKSLAMAAVVAVALEAGLAVGLNRYADSQTTAVTPMVQDFYAAVAVAVEQGNEIASGQAPAGVTFATVKTQAQAAATGLGSLDTPGELVSYATTVNGWASSVVAAAGNAAEGANWSAPTAPAFQLSMTADQVNAAFAASSERIKTLIQYGDYAFGTNNAEALLWIGAQFEAQSYWLKDVSTSAEPNWIAAHLHFIEPVNSPTVAMTGSKMDIDPVALSSIRASRPQIELTGDLLFGIRGHSKVPSPTPGFSPVRCWGGCEHTEAFLDYLGNLAQAVMPGPNPSDADLWNRTKAEIPQLLSPPSANLTPDTTMISQTPLGDAPPQSFVDECGGGNIDWTQPNTNQLPPTGPGWRCHQFNSPCWIWRSETGTEYKGGSGDCTQQNVLPPQDGPMAGLVAQVGRTLHSSLATPVTPTTTTPTPTTATPTPTPPPPTTPTPQCPPGYPYYNAADNKCYQQPPTTPTPTPAPVTLPPGFPTNLPSGTYQLSLCGTGVGCINLGSQEFNSDDIAELVNRLQQAISEACQGNSGCTTTYSAFNGSSFTATMKWVDGCVPGDPNSCIRGQDEIVVTKVG